jgi:hypothetical protein
MNNYQNTALDWNSEIQNDDQFVILNPGEYDFTITGFERGYFDGSDKIEPCNKAVITITVNSPQGVVDVDSQLLLSTKMEWKLSQFFTAIGRKKKGEKLVMNWDNLIGLKGRVDIGNRKHNGNTYNDVKRWLPAPGYDVQSGGGGGYQPQAGRY